MKVREFIPHISLIPKVLLTLSLEELGTMAKTGSPAYLDEFYVWGVTLLLFIFSWSAKIILFELLRCTLTEISFHF